MTLNRRRFLTACTRAGIASPLLPGVLCALASQAQDTAGVKADGPVKITAEMIDQAGAMAGVGPFTDDQKRMMLDGLNDQRSGYDAIRALNLPNSMPPAFVFHPLPAAKTALAVECETLPHASGETMIGIDNVANLPSHPAQIEDLAFATVGELSALLRSRQITSVTLTQMYLDRLKRYDAKLHFVITLTEERALAQARKADEEIARGEISRAAARDSVGRQGPACREGISDDMGRRRIRASIVRRGCFGGAAAG